MPNYRKSHKNNRNKNRNKSNNNNNNNNNKQNKNKKENKNENEEKKNSEIVANATAAGIVTINENQIQQNSSGFEPISIAKVDLIDAGNFNESTSTNISNNNYLESYPKSTNNNNNNNNNENENSKENKLLKSNNNTITATDTVTSDTATNIDHQTKTSKTLETSFDVCITNSENNFQKNFNQNHYEMGMVNTKSLKDELTTTTTTNQLIKVSDKKINERQEGYNCRIAQQPLPLLLSSLTESSLPTSFPTTTNSSLVLPSISSSSSFSEVFSASPFAQRIFDEFNNYWRHFDFI